tara:strand:- start:365 stop:1393 length:1029 start_codon:yes stop_codon:yes gene_type:complete
MNSKSITNYILKLEHDNQDLSETVRTLEFDQIGLKKKIRDMVDTLDQVKKERDEGIGKLLDADIQRIGRVLNEPEKPSLFETTARVTQTSVNEGIAARLRELGDMTSDFYKCAAYQRAAIIIEHLPYEVESGVSVSHIKGIGKSISAKIDEYLDELDSDYDDSEDADSESISSDGEEDTDAESVASNDDEYHVSYNRDISDMLYNLADSSSDTFKSKAYTKAAVIVDSLDYRVNYGKNLLKFDGIGKGIAAKIDAFLEGDLTNQPNKKLANLFLKLGNLEENQFKSERYWHASDVLKVLEEKVSHSDDVKGIKGFGRSILNKIDEFVETGKIARIQELSKSK